VRSLGLDWALVGDCTVSGVSVCITLAKVAELFDLDALDQENPFEIDSQAAHLFKHAPFGTDDVLEVWQSDPLADGRPGRNRSFSWCHSLRPIPEKRHGVGRLGVTSPLSSSRRSLPGGPMTKKVSRTEEHEFYADPDNQTPQGPARRRKAKLTELVPVRFAPDTLEKVRAAADADDRSVSSWIRRAVERELEAKTA